MLNATTLQASIRILSKQEIDCEMRKAYSLGE